MGRLLILLLANSLVRAWANIQNLTASVNVQNVEKRYMRMMLASRDDTPFALVVADCDSLAFNHYGDCK